MIKYMAFMAMLCLFAGMASGTMWLYYDPTFFQVGAQFSAPYFKPANISPFEIINAPYFPLLGEGFYMNPVPVQIQNTTSSIEIRSSGKVETPPPLMTFGGHEEDNLKYAASKSSLRVASGGSWTTLGPQGF